MKPRTLFYFLSFSVLLTSCGDRSEDYNTDKQTIRLVDLGHGVAREDGGYHTKKLSDDELASDFTIATETDTITARQGVRFGVRYMLESNLESSVPLQQVWTFPDSMRDEKGNVYKDEHYEIDRKPNEETYAAYQLDFPYEVIKGKWVLHIYYKKHLLYRKIFLLR